jgi:hypothetical protein
MIKFIYIILPAFFVLSSCASLHNSSKYEFRDGIYNTKLFSKRAQDEVYVFRIDEDTLVICPVIEFPDSTAILVKKKTVYTGLQKKFKDGESRHTFYKPSFDIDAITLPLLFRPATDGIPNQLESGFNGAIFLGYRTDVYIVDYDRTPFNNYKQSVKHYGTSTGLFLGIGSTIIDTNTTKNIYLNKDYEGMTLIYGLGVNTAIENINFGISIGLADLLDKNHEYWLFEGKPFIGFTLGINLN